MPVLTIALSTRTLETIQAVLNREIEREGPGAAEAFEAYSEVVDALADARRG